MKKLGIIAAVVLPLVACETTEEALKKAGHKPLSAAQIKQALSGNTIEGVSAQSGNSFDGFVGKNGIIRILFDNGRGDEGTWRVTKDNTVCTKYSWIRQGDENCRRVYKVGNEYQSIQLDGSASSKYKIIKGNPKNL